MWGGLKSPHYCTKISTKKFGSLKNLAYLCTEVKQLKNNNYDNTRKKEQD